MDDHAEDINLSCLEKVPPPSEKASGNEIMYTVSIQPGQISRKKVLVGRILQCYKNQEEEDA